MLFSLSVVSNPLGPPSHALQHARLTCPSPTPRACSNSFPSSQWCHPTISSSVIPFSCLQSFPASGSFPMSWLFASGDQNIGASASVLPMSIQDWFPLGLTGLFSLQSNGLSGVISNITIQKHQFFGAQPSLWSRKEKNIFVFWTRITKALRIYQLMWKQIWVFRIWSSVIPFSKFRVTKFLTPWLHRPAWNSSSRWRLQHVRIHTTYLGHSDIFTPFKMLLI